MANTPNPKKPEERHDRDTSKTGQAGQPGQKGQGGQQDPNQRSGHEYQAPPVHRTDTKDATMGRPGAAGRDPNRRNEGETQTQQTEFAGENDEPRAGGERSRHTEGQNQGQTQGQNQGQNQGQHGKTGQPQAGQTQPGGKTRNT